MASEKSLERKLREGVEALGGKCYKLSSLLVKGLPDRLILLPGARAAFVEVKTTGKKPSPMQRHIMAGLIALGFEVHVLDNDIQLQKMLKVWSSYPTTTRPMQ